LEAIESGTLAGMGSFRCESCGFMVNLSVQDEVPTCPGCGGNRFQRASLFGQDRPFEGRPWPDTAPDDLSWLEEARRSITDPGQYLVYEADDDRVDIVPLNAEWTRIGRSLAADVRFDDPTVSRRHALIVRQPDGVRVLDDRSLNGVFVNGERVEWSVLGDGDEILVGRHSLRFLDVTEVPPAPLNIGGSAELAS
jgi:pSer/pThr/pTyr-binding forkhead associated (FHA) protein